MGLLETGKNCLFDQVYKLPGQKSLGARPSGLHFRDTLINLNSDNKTFFYSTDTLFGEVLLILKSFIILLQTQNF